jgi:endonuclease/exonuclease/phosphatase family metal-dependent hydrolase
MSDGRRLNRQVQDQAIRFALRYPRVVLVLLGLAALAALAYFVWTNLPKRTTPPPVAGDGMPATVFFCAWNVENFFDDEDNPKVHDDMEDWFGTDPAAFPEKVDHLAEGLLKMNGGAGPDVACLCEVESERCLSALREAVNAKFDAAGLGDRKYTAVLFKGDNTGRHFAPGILTRLAVTADRTRKLGKRQNGRIIEGHLHRNGHELIVIAAHWTSRVTDKEGDGGRRADYAEDCYGRVRAILHESPDADVIVCGDFNDEFKDVSIQTELHATDSPEAVRNSLDEPRLLDLLAGWGAAHDPPGSIHGRGKWSVFDHICVTRGLLDDRGWSCDPKNARVVAPDEFRHKVGRGFEPFAFGKANHKGPRGYSDHFPVAVELSVAGKD